MDYDMENKSQQPKRYSLYFLQKITENFSSSRILGSGGFGTVYKGVDKKGNILAVKKLRICEGMNEKKFEDEVKHLMYLKHQNIVNLEGYCYQEEKELMLDNGKQVFISNIYMLLCFEYLPNGDLCYYIKGNELDWTTRYKIIEGICKGLHYLHEELKGTSIIHLDLKPDNILLDENMMPKITDFGMSRLFENENTHVTTENLGGSRGYTDPEYIEKYIFSKKSDIYSLGVMIIEIIVGERKYPDNIGMSLQEFIETVHQEWRRRLLASRNTLLEEYCQQVKTCTEIGLTCMERNPKKRPNIVDIIYKLNERNPVPTRVVETKMVAVTEVEGLYPDNIGMSLQELFETVHQEWRRRLLASRNTLFEEDCQLVKTCTKIGLTCMERNPKKRPNIVDIIYKLNEREGNVGFLRGGGREGPGHGHHEGAQAQGQQQCPSPHAPGRDPQDLRRLHSASKGTDDEPLQRHCDPVAWGFHERW